MLHKLTISNYALIDNLEISFTDGMTTITGETGAGKSIILGVLLKRHFLCQTIHLQHFLNLSTLTLTKRP